MKQITVTLKQWITSENVILAAVCMAFVGAMFMAAWTAFTNQPPAQSLIPVDERNYAGECLGRGGVAVLDNRMRLKRCLIMKPKMTQ
jgi:hypothetical protein